MTDLSVDGVVEEGEAGTLDWVRQCAVPAATAAEIRSCVMQSLMATARARFGLFHTVASVDGEPYWARVQPHGDPAVVGFLRECDGEPMRKWGDLQASALTTLNRFCITHAEQVRTNKLYTRMWQPMACISCLAMSVVVAGRLVGWVGVHRVEGEQPFGEEDLRAVQAHADAYAHALEVAYNLDARSSGTHAVVMLDGEGRVRLQCEGAGRWLHNQAFVNELAERTRRLSGDAAALWMGGAIVRLTRVQGDTQSLVCAQIAPAEVMEMPAVAYLSPQKRRVAELAALGATTGEIASALSIGAETVRTHLKGIYDQLGVTSRVELVEHVRVGGAP